MTGTLVFDARWEGPHGIGRFAREVRRRLTGRILDVTGAHPVSARGLIESEVLPHLTGARGATYFSPGYTPCLTWRGRHAFTVHDLIHLDVPGEGSRMKTGYYAQFVRRAVRRQHGVVLTVSEFSRQRIARWADVAPSRISVVGNGVDPSFTPHGPKADLGFPYVLHVGNTKPHKNLARLVAAVAQVPDVHLVCSSEPHAELIEQAAKLGLETRLHFRSGIPEAELPKVYRGATAVVIPSLYEGFGLPALEGMASGVPVVASGTTALADVVDSAAVLVDPTDIDSIAHGINTAIADEAVRGRLATAGPERAADFTWDKVAAAVTSAIGGPR